MVDNFVEGLPVPIYDGDCPAIRKRELFLHLCAHGVEFINGLINYAGRVLADIHVVLSDFLSHQLYFCLYFV